MNINEKRSQLKLFKSMSNSAAETEGRSNALRFAACAYALAFEISKMRGSDMGDYDALKEMSKLLEDRALEFSK